jgi:hypothetical protein
MTVNITVEGGDFLPGEKNLEQFIRKSLLE